MLLKGLFILLYLLLAGPVVYGQVLKGIVVDGENNAPLAAVAVVNMQTNQSAYTDATGRFVITAKKGEQVSFSSVGYRNQLKTVPAALGVAEMKIEMFHISYELEEFVLRPKYTPYQMDSIARQSTYARALARQKGGSIMSPVTLIAEKLSKRSKRIFNFQKSFNYWEDVKYIESRYTPEMVSSLTGLKGDSLAYFMNAYPMAFDYARVVSDLELKMWVRNNYKAWIKSPDLPAFIRKQAQLDSTLGVHTH
jgi:hypothetical protein